jgi:hypothetical protein
LNGWPRDIALIISLFDLVVKTLTVNREVVRDNMSVGEGEAIQIVF